MAEDMMNEEMAGMALPTEVTEEPAISEETPVETGITVDAMKANYDAMEPEKQKAVQAIMNEPIGQLFDELTGQTVMSEFAMSIGVEEAPAEEPAPAAEGMMAPTEEPMADSPEESPVAMSDGGILGRKYGETSPENAKLIKLYKEDKLSLQGMQEFARDIDSRRLSENESDMPSKEEMDAFYDMAYEYGDEELLPEKYSDK
jgi:hypothetical protein